MDTVSNLTDQAGRPDVDLWTAFADPLRAFVRKRLPSDVDVEDVMQDVFLRIVRNADSLSTVKHLEAWVFQVARSALADALRSHARRRARVSPLEVDDLPDPTTDEALAAIAELSPCVTPVVARLREPYRTALVLTAMEGLTQKDAAARQGISLSGMKSRVQRARDQVRDLMLQCCAMQFDAHGSLADFDVRDATVCGDPAADNGDPGCGSGVCVHS